MVSLDHTHLWYDGVHWTTTTYGVTGYIGPHPLQHHRVHWTTPTYGITGYIGPCLLMVSLDHTHLWHHRVHWITPTYGIIWYIEPHPLMESQGTLDHTHYSITGYIGPSITQPGNVLVLLTFKLLACRVIESCGRC